MKNSGRIYAITSGVVVVGALVLLLIVVLLWYIFGYDYVIAPSTVTLIEGAAP